MGSETYSAPAGTVTSVLPPNVSAFSDAGAIRDEDAEIARAMWTDVKCSGSVPNAFEICTRTVDPPIDRCTICRMVMSRMSSGGSALCGSGICWDAAHVATHLVSGDCDCAAVAARTIVRNTVT